MFELLIDICRDDAPKTCTQVVVAVPGCMGIGPMGEVVHAQETHPGWHIKGLRCKGAKAGPATPQSL